MKLKMRFIFFFIIGLFAFILFAGIFVVAFFDFFIPRMGLQEGFYPLIEISAILFPFLLGGILLGLFFVRPLVHVLSLIRDLSSGSEHLSRIDGILYKKNGRLKPSYFLYRELIADIYNLSHYLDSAKRQREKLELAKSNWIAGVSHDLKTPLSYITGYSSLLLDKNKTWSEGEQKDFLNQIHDKSVLISEMIGDLNLSFKLDALGKTYPLSKALFNIVDFSKRLLADIANNPNAAAYVFGFQSSDTHITVNADQKLLYRAIQNLVINAVNHNPQGTSIEIIIKKFPETGHVTITVSDNGVGMDHATLNKLFQRYYRPQEADDISGGLGLSLVKSIVEAHDGTIQIESVNGKGTNVTVKMQYA